MRGLNIFIRVCLCAMLVYVFTACRYQEIFSDDYPEGKIYLPIAAKGIVYTIDEITQASSTNPTPGSTFQYKIDREANQFIIPLAIYRSGINPGSAISVRISEDTEIVSSLIEEMLLEDEVEVLPSGKYTLNQTVAMAKGQETAQFELIVDLQFLLDRAPQKHALGITVSCEEQECNPDLNTVVVVVDTKILLP